MKEKLQIAKDTVAKVLPFDTLEASAYFIISH